MAASDDEDGPVRWSEAGTIRRALVEAFGDDEEDE